MPVVISNKQRKYKIDTKKLRAVFDQIAAKAGCNSAEISVVFVADGAIRRINKRYRGKDIPTDCISFPMREGGTMAHPRECQPELLGDIVISVETAARQNDDLEEEIVLLFIHSLLHLLGYDHQTVEEERRMKKREEGLFNEIR